MKKVVLIILVVIFSGCAQNIPKEYNAQVERYDKLIEVEYPVAYKKSSDQVLLKTDVSFYDIEVNKLQSKITDDGIISKEELEKFTKSVDEMEEIINNG